MTKESQEPPEAGKHVQLKFVVPPEVTTAFANQLVVQMDDLGQVHISFFEIRPPLILGDEKERLQKLDEINEVEARCVARVVMPGQLMPSVIGAFAENYRKTSKRHESKKDDAEVSDESSVSQKHA